MATVLPTVSDIVDALGGAGPVAKMFNCSSNAVYNWTASDRLPARTYFGIRDALREHDKVAPDHLWTMAAPATATAAPVLADTARAS